MEISAKTVMVLRQKTGAGMMDCKKALQESGGDMEAAITYLREKGISKAAKKATRVAAQGLVFTAVSTDRRTGTLLEFNSETDFVAKNREFIEFGNTLVKAIIKHGIKDLDELNHYKINGETVQEITTGMIARIGENMHIRKFRLFNTNGFLCDYLHLGGKIGVVVDCAAEYNQDNLEKARDVAMQIAAMDPMFLDRSVVTPEVLEKEKSIIRSQLREEGKPEEIIDKIMMGKLNKFYEDNCLLQQKFVKDDKVTVQQYLQGMKINSYERYRLGEGIEKGESDFAAEVAAQIKG